MASHSTYLRYKRDERLLLYWITHASNFIIRSFPAEVPANVVTTGEIHLSTLISLSALIAKHINPVPPTIFRLFQSIISARKQTHEFFMRCVAENPNPETEKGNVSHKHWIDGLTQAFEALGGGSYQSNGVESTEEDEEEVIFSNKFSILSIKDETSAHAEQDDLESNPEEPHATSARPVTRRSTKKGTRGRKRRQPKRKKAPVATKPTPADIPFESYRLVSDDKRNLMEYMMAAESIIKQWINLRRDIQVLWREVAYGGLNSAVAGAVSNVAVGMISNTQSKIFIDFPEQDSFATITNIMTMGNPDKAQVIYNSMWMDEIGHVEELKEIPWVGLDVREQLLMHTYHNLLEFIMDFQKSGSGKPTKRLLKEIQNWDPTFDLQKANKEQRVKWRRAYTIYWLYDFVNAFLSSLVQRLPIKGEGLRLDRVDCSVTEPPDVHQRVFPLKEFAGDISRLAKQKPGSQIVHKICPHHVFQLQCIVDSLTVSRGWSPRAFRDDILEAPASSFRTKRDVDLFLGLYGERDTGFHPKFRSITKLWERDAAMYGIRQQSVLLKSVEKVFMDWFGERNSTAIPSRLSASNPNALWEYSPLLCGVGLVEALELSYGAGLRTLDQMAEPIYLVNLHYTLLKKGYLAQPIDAYESFQRLYDELGVVNGVKPTTGFYKALELLSFRMRNPRPATNFQNRRRAAKHVTTDMNALLNSSSNSFLKRKSLLCVYREAGWVWERISDKDIPIPSSLAGVRLIKTKDVFDPVSCRILKEETELIKRARIWGVDDSKIRESSVEEGEPAPLPDFLSGKRRTYKHKKVWADDDDLLARLHEDLYEEICGESDPYSGSNYFTIASNFLSTFEEIEDRLAKIRHPYWVDYYEKSSAGIQAKRLSLTLSAMYNDDDECLKAIAAAFEDQRLGLLDYSYWDELDGPWQRTSKLIRPNCPQM